MMKKQIVSVLAVLLIVLVLTTACRTDRGRNAPSVPQPPAAATAVEPPASTDPGEAIEQELRQLEQEFEQDEVPEEEPNE